MQRVLKFEKESNDLWYVVLPEWEKEHWELQMVVGADVMLDVLSEGGREVSLFVTTEKPAQSMDMLDLLETNPENISGGATYRYLSSDGNLTMDLWLCHVAHFVFDMFPECIWLQKTANQN